MVGLMQCLNYRESLRKYSKNTRRYRDEQERAARKGKTAAGIHPTAEVWGNCHQGTGWVTGDGGESDGEGEIMNKATKKMVEEIYDAVSPKLFNINNGTANEKEIQIAKECMAYISLLKYSCMDEREVKELWDKSNLAFM